MCDVINESPIVELKKLPGRLGNGPGIPVVVAVKVGWGRSLGRGSNLEGGGGAKKNESLGRTMPAMSPDVWREGGV